MLFAFGRPAVGKVLEQKFQGEWKYLRKTIYETGEVRADRALREMATQLRLQHNPTRWGNRPISLWIAEEIGCCASG
jgi:hypothetical protein